MPFSMEFDPISIRALLARAPAVGRDDVARVLAHGVNTLDDAAALLSPAADGMLEDLAAAAHRATVERFGRTIALYAPLYLSNECVCTCTYCGFSMGLDIRRRTLFLPEIEREAEALRRAGIRNILLVASEHPKRVPAAYVAQAVARVKRIAPYVAVEIAAADDDDYAEYVAAGCDGVVLYQETYDAAAYARHHLGGPKMKFAWRMDAVERASKSGVKHLGIGALLGLADWRFDALSLIAHARHLERGCWRSQINVSLPRINAAAGGYVPAHAVGDRDFVRLISFVRLCLPTAGIVLSTRERADLRDRLVPLGITQMSAGSSTEPGGYESPGEAGQQFELSDERSPAEVAGRLRELGYDPVFKDWEIMTPAEAAV